MRALFLLLLLAIPVSAFPYNPPRTNAPRWKPQGDFIVPAGTVNLAFRKPVTSSDDAPIIGDLPMITDGENECGEGNWVELGPGTHWVQIDLKNPCRIFGVQMWHFFCWTPQVTRNVIVQVSNDPEFKKEVQTIYNNDDDNSSKLGKGKDLEYYESRFGYRIDTRGKNYSGLVARYVRLYSRGNSGDPTNQYIEVEVIGKQLQPLPGKGNQQTPQSSLETFPWRFKYSLPDYTSIWHDNAEAPTPIDLTDFRVPLDSREISSEGTNRINPFNSTENLRPTKTKLPVGYGWSQKDFGSVRRIYAVSVYSPDRSYRMPSENPKNFVLPHDLIVLCADDAAFTKNVKTLFDGATSKYANSTGRNYKLLIDTRGKDFQGINTRFIRIYSRSNRLTQPGDGFSEVIGTSPPPIIQSKYIRWQTNIPNGPYL